MESDLEIIENDWSPCSSLIRTQTIYILLQQTTQETRRWGKGSKSNPLTVFHAIVYRGENQNDNTQRVPKNQISPKNDAKCSPNKTDSIIPKEYKG